MDGRASVSGDTYLLDGRRVIPCDDLDLWGDWLESARRHLWETTIGPYAVTTRFLGCDRSGGDGEPELFETEVYNGATGISVVFVDALHVYSTYEQAEQGHDAICERVRRLAP